MDFTPDPPVDEYDAAYREGQSAYEKGTPRHENPYSWLDAEEGAEGWNEGWDDAKAEYESDAQADY